MKIIFFLILLYPACLVFSQETLSIAAYNVYEYTPDSTAAKKSALSDVISAIDPDLLIGVEIEDNPTTADEFRTSVLNSVTTDKYFLGSSPTTSAWGGFSNFAYYKPQKFTYLGASIIADFGKWPTLQFQLYNNLTGDKIIIYGTHLSSTGSQDRSDEADSIRVSSDALPTDAYFIAAGDFNFVIGAGEQAYGKLIDQGKTGYFLDPGDFSGLHETFKSTGFIGRFDMVLHSQSVDDAGGIQYVTNSFTVDGNTGGGSSDSLHKTASDHLPVYSDFSFNVPSPVNPPYPGSIVFTQVGATDPDVIEFITLYRMDLTTLKITDNSIDINGNLSTTEGTFDLSNLNLIGDWNDVPAGTFVRLDANLTEDDNASDRFLVYDGTGSGTLPSLTTGGEQLIAYTGSSSDPTYIAGVNWGNSGWTGPNSYAPGTPSDLALGTSNDYVFNSTVDDILYVTRNALTNSSNWSVQSSPGTYTDLSTKIGHGALPVELAFFTANLNGNNIELRWKTETEVNNFGFEIERKAPLNPPEGGSNGEWETIGFVEGNGNSNSPKHYSFVDNEINQSGTYYYRLKQIDNDGTFEYSNISAVEVGVPNNYYLSQNYPNPFNPSTKIDYTLPEKQLVTLRVYNILGEMVHELVNEEKPAGSYSVTFDASNLPSGVYIYRLQTEGFAQNRKMTLLK